MEEKTLTERIEAILTPTGRTRRDPEMQRITILPGHRAGRAAALADAMSMIDLADTEMRLLSIVQDVLDIETDPLERRYYPVPAAGNRHERRAEQARWQRNKKKRR